MKEALVQKYTIPKPLANLRKSLIISLEIAHTKVTQEEVSEALMAQSIRKAPGPDMIDFEIL